MSILAPERLRGHRAPVTAVTVAADGTQAVSAAGDGTMRVWRLASGRVSGIVPTTGEIAYVHTGPEARQVAAYTDGAAQVWNPTTGEVQSLDGPATRVTAYAVSGDASRGISGDPDEGATVWDLSATAEPALRLPRHSGRVTAVAVTADGRGVATAAEPGTVAVWDLETGRARVELDHGRTVTALCLTPRADRVIVGDHARLTVYLIDDATTQRPATRAPVTALAANPALSRHVLFETAMGQVAYIQVP